MKKIIIASLFAQTSFSLASINFVADYTADAANYGFNDSSLGASRKAAFDHALSVMESYFDESYAGETIVVKAMFADLGGSSNSATLGFAGAATAHVSNGNITGSPLANHIAMNDVNGATNEINITFNADVDGPVVFGTNGFYYGTDAMPGGESDFVTTALHEISHGLGYSSQILHSSSQGPDGSFLNAPNPGQFDTFLYDAQVGGNLLTSLDDAGRAAAITSDNLWWGGANGVAANGGRIKMYAPNTYESGSSTSHVDEGAHGDLTLSPSLSGNVINHQFSAIELGIFEDLGWDMAAVPEPSSTLLLGLGSVFLVLRRKK